MSRIQDRTRVSDGDSNLFLRIFLRHRSAILLIGHTIAFALIFPLAYGLRFDWRLPHTEVEALRRALPWVVLIKLAVFRGMGGHRGWWRYATFADLVRLVETTTLCTAALVAAAFISRFGLETPRSVVALDWAGTILLLGGLRCSTRLVRERYYPMISATSATPVLVVGATEAGLSLVRMVQSQPGLGMRVVGLLDPDPWLTGQTLGGVRVLGTLDNIGELAKRQVAKEVLVPTPAVGPRSIRALVDVCNGVGVRVRVVPGFDAILQGSLNVQPRDVDIEDLLFRAPVSLDDALVGNFLHDKTVLVTGAAGSIGSELCRQVLRHGPARLVLMDHSENGLFFIERELRERRGNTEILLSPGSVTDAPRVRGAMRKHRPAIVFHAAAHKHVPMMEDHPGEAVKTNVFGTRTVLDEALDAGVEAFVMISTDKAVQATSVMGATKRLAEMYVQARSATVGSRARLVTVRFGNVLGSNGSVVPIFKEQIRKGGPVTVTDPEMTRYFMTIPEATQLVLQAGAQGRGGEIFVLDMGEPVRVVDLAKDLIRLSGVIEEGEIEIKFTGLRPGEKLHERLYDAEEPPQATPHPKIFISQHRQSDLVRLEALMERLQGITERSRSVVIAALREAVPDYHPRSTTIPMDSVSSGSEVEPIPLSHHASSSTT
ncbi:MAG: polysaccharide biosynthesis protein [Isosphaeraceae bacterium]